MTYLEQFQSILKRHDVKQFEHFEYLHEHTGFGVKLNSLLAQSKAANEYTANDLEELISFSQGGYVLTVLDAFGDVYVAKFDGIGGIVATRTVVNLPGNLAHYGFSDLAGFFQHNPDVRTVPYIPNGVSITNELSNELAPAIA